MPDSVLHPAPLKTTRRFVRPSTAARDSKTSSLGTAWTGENMWDAENQPLDLEVGHCVYRLLQAACCVCDVSRARHVRKIPNTWNNSMIVPREANRMRHVLVRMLCICGSLLTARAFAAQPPWQLEPTPNVIEDRLRLE